MADTKPVEWATAIRVKVNRVSRTYEAHQETKIVRFQEELCRE